MTNVRAGMTTEELKFEEAWERCETAIAALIDEPPKSVRVGREEIAYRIMLRLANSHIGDLRVIVDTPSAYSWGRRS